MRVNPAVARVIMTASPGNDRLSERQYVVLLIRALVDRDDRLLSGEVGGPDELGGPERWVSFSEPGLLAHAVEMWVGHVPKRS